MIRLKIKAISKLIIFGLILKTIMILLLCYIVFRINKPIIIEKDVVIYEYIEVDNNIEKIESIMSIEENVIIEMDVPNVNTSFKSWLHWELISDESTPQWKLQQLTITNEDGLRTYNGRFCIATSKYYGEIGTKLNITFDTGKVSECIISELKDPNDERSVKYGHKMEDDDINIIEFILDENVVDREVLYTGDISNLNDEFKGNIVEINKII